MPPQPTPGSPGAGAGTPVTRVVRLVRALSTQADRYAHGVRERLHLHATDLTAMGIINDAHRDGARLTPSALAGELHLSASAVTALLGRLEQLGHVRRRPHGEDGRKVVVDMSPEAASLASRSFHPLSAAIREVLARRTDAELALVEEVLGDVVEAMSRACAVLPPGSGNGTTARSVTVAAGPAPGTPLAAG